MKAEHIDRATQLAQAASRKGARSVRAQGAVQDREIAFEFLKAVIGRRLANRMARHVAMPHAARRLPLIGALIINIWEEMALAGSSSAVHASRWGVVGGLIKRRSPSPASTSRSLLARRPPYSPSDVATNVLYLFGVAIGVRLLIARVDVWSGRCLLVVGLLHSSFNATENLLQPEFFWVRIVVTITLGRSRGLRAAAILTPEEQSASGIAS